MSENAVFYDKERFAPVVERVFGKTSEQNILKGKDRLTEIKFFMDSAAESHRTYKTLATKCHGTCQKTLMLFAKEEKDQFVRLRTAYYILTGETYTPEIRVKKYPGIMSALRVRYETERSLEKAYADATKNEEKDDIAKLYTQLAAKKGEHAATITKLLESMLS